jgi:high affinity Mn2+ porin
MVKRHRAGCIGGCVWQATLDYQFVANPSYNRDRGPVSLVAFRLFSQF